MRPSMLMRATAPLLVGALAVLSVYVLVRAHHAPGGGFSAGLLMASAIAVELIAFGLDGARRTLRIDPRCLVGFGVLAAATAAWLGPLLGKPLLAPLWGPYIPGLAHLSTVLLFDFGVYLIVGGTAITIMFALVGED